MVFCSDEQLNELADYIQKRSLPSPSLPFPLPSLLLPSLPLPLEVGPLLRLGGLGERSPAAKRYLVNFRLKISPLVATIFRNLGESALIINALPPKFLQKRFPYFSMVHLLHRLYGVDAPGGRCSPAALERGHMPVPMEMRHYPTRITVPNFVAL